MWNLDLTLLYQALEDLSLQYDSSVRNSENTVVQFSYGDDGLHPDKMENNDRPVDFDRLRMAVQELYPCAEEEALTGDEIMQNVEQVLQSTQFNMPGSSSPLLRDTKEYFISLAKAQKELLDETSSEEFKMCSWSTCRLTASQLSKMLDTALKRCITSFVEPGEAIGAIGAQSISEPGTQMTLKVRYKSLCCISNRCCRHFISVESVQ